MLVILKEDIPNLGFKDEIVTVKDGYGRNFLIPRGLAVIASESAKKILAENQKQRAHKLAKIKEDAQKLAQRIEGTELTLKAKTSSTGTIFGSVNTVQIADELEKKGFEINRKMIQIPSGIKEIGDYVAKIRLHKEVAVEVPFHVISENVTAIQSKKESSEKESNTSTDEPQAQESNETTTED